MKLAMRLTAVAAVAALAGAAGTASAQSAQPMNDSSMDQATPNQTYQQDSNATRDHSTFRAKLKAWTSPRSSPAQIEQDAGNMAARPDRSVQPMTDPSSEGSQAGSDASTPNR